MTGYSRKVFDMKAMISPGERRILAVLSEMMISR
jgi:hypothetical protein